MVTGSGLPPLVVALPLFGSGILAWAAKTGVRRRNLAANLIALGTFLLAAWQLFLVQKGSVLDLVIPWPLGFGLRWRVDFISALFAAAVALVWLLATYFAAEYMAGEQNSTRYSIASLFTLGSTLGVFLAGDLFSLFLFFELMTFAAYLLVVHEESEEALRAGNVYLFMSVIGGLFLLGVIFFLQHLAGTTEFKPGLDLVVASGLNPWILFAAVILGFGVKAGMLPLHIWLPKAHPVAPAPASALLSALMIKTGAYGFLRFFYVLFTAEGVSYLSLQENFGYVFIWLGALTMLGGALMALVHSPMKRVLAYSSISQMGYILFSLGVGVMLGDRGAFGFAGMWLHMINHAFFKSFLFLLAGAVYLQTGELDLNELGGLQARMPRALGFFLAAAAGITGIPGFNGYVSKVLIHDGILQAYALKGWPVLFWLERVFVLTGGLTAAYITKIWLKTFFGRGKRNWRGVKDLSPAHTGIFAVKSPNPNKI
ncbi:MAG TPA: NADH dehydrogenase, partial [Firmicutes bacterium]|nr:NADH dehydrogenase [Bacillota bacterium]